MSVASRRLQLGAPHPRLPSAPPAAGCSSLCSGRGGQEQVKPRRCWRSRQALVSVMRGLQQPDVDASQGWLMDAIGAFLEENLADPANSPNLLESSCDDLRPILSAISCCPPPDEILQVPILQILKILLRKPVNRQALGVFGVEAIAGVLTMTSSPEVLSECANVILNMCYDHRNVALFLDAGGLALLLPLVVSAEAACQASSLGALQSILYTRRGRDEARRFGLTELAVKLLNSPCSEVQARALGCVHNLSTDTVNLGPILQEGGTEPLVHLLRAPSPGVCSDAAGTIQNLAREKAGRAMLNQALGPLGDLLTGSDVACQVSAAGALLNLVGADLNASERTMLRACLTEGIVLGALTSALRD
jgi:hypothetical protein